MNNIYEYNGYSGTSWTAEKWGGTIYYFLVFFSHTHMHTHPHIHPHTHTYTHIHTYIHVRKHRNKRWGGMTHTHSYSCPYQ